MSDKSNCIIRNKSPLYPINASQSKIYEKPQDQTQVSSCSNQFQKGMSCPKCTFQNINDSIKCIICSFVFQEKINQLILPSRIFNKIQISSSIVNCKKCNLQNHLSNQYCLNCEEQLFEHIKRSCLICEIPIKQENYEKHYELCLLSKQLIEEQQIQEISQKVPKIPINVLSSIKPKIDNIKKPYPKLMGKASYKVPKVTSSKSGFIKGAGGFIGGHPSEDKSTNKRYQHSQMCQIPQQFLADLQICQKRVGQIKQMQACYAKMTPLQVKAIIHMHEKSAIEHQIVKKKLQERVGKLGYNKDDLQNLKFYIQNYAPIIIQIHVSKHMQFFVEDTHYRSQFQTNKSSGSLSRTSRTQWQNKMFDNKYQKATDFQRVKYGVINFTNDPKGVHCAKSYGNSYFLLKSHVRDRCTFSDKDSSSNDVSLATLRFGFKIVCKMNDSQLKAAFKASKALQQSSGVCVTYKQLQIHGPIQFDKDIERIYVSKGQVKDQKNILDLVYLFSQKFKVQYDFI